MGSTQRLCCEGRKATDKQRERSLSPLLLLCHAAFGVCRSEAFIPASTRACGQRVGRGAQKTPQLQLMGPLDEQNHVADTAEAPMGDANGAANTAKAQLISSGSGGVLATLKNKPRTTGGRREDADSLLLYFAFGANMCPSILTGKRGVEPFASMPAEAIQFYTDTRQHRDIASGLSGVRSRDGGGIQRTIARGICVCFCHRAGYATLARIPGPPQSWEPSPGAYGVLHAISSSSLKKIAAAENGYQERMVVVETLAGERDLAVCFVSKPWQTLPTSVPPTSRYLSVLRNGAKHHGVDERYRSWLARLPSVRPEDAAVSRERTDTPSKIVTDAVLTIVAIAALGAVVKAINPC